MAIPNGLFSIVNNQLVVASGVTLDANTFASDSISVTVTDSAGASVTQSFSIVVDPIPGVTIDGKSTDDTFSLTSAVHTTNGADTVHGNNGNDRCRYYFDACDYVQHSDCSSSDSSGGDYDDDG